MGNLRFGIEIIEELRATLSARDERVRELEAELADSRPIVQAARLYYQAELAGNEKAMLAGLRAIQAAFERGTIADHARRMAAPAEKPREVVEPAPAPAQRWRCEGCGWEGEDWSLSNPRGAFRSQPDDGVIRHSVSDRITCGGPVVPVGEAGC